jgi:hypothetical protein
MVECELHIGLRLLNESGCLVEQGVVDTSKVFEVEFRESRNIMHHVSRQELLARFQIALSYLDHMTSRVSTTTKYHFICILSLPTMIRQHFQSI